MAGSAAIGAGAAYSLVVLLTTELIPADGVAESGLYRHPWTFGPFLTPAALVFLLWLAAFIALLVRWQRTGAWLLTAAAAWASPSNPVFGPTFTMHFDVPPDHGNGTLSLLPSGASFLFLSLLALLAGGDRGRLSSRRAGWFGVLGGIGVMGLVMVSVATTTTLGTFNDQILWNDQPACRSRSRGSPC